MADENQTPPSENANAVWVTILVVFILILVIGGVFYLVSGRDANTTDQEGRFTTSAPTATSTPVPTRRPTLTLVPTEESNLELTPMEENESSPSPASEARTFEITGRNFEFSQSEIQVQQGDRVRVVLTSTEGMHDFVIEEFNVASERVSPGQSDTIEFVANQVGTFFFYCSVANHRVLGMEGTLIVE